MTTQFIPLDKIVPNPEQPRQHFDEDALHSLAQSIAVNGLLQPILVEEAADCYILRDGERRWRAHRMLGHTSIEAVIRPAATDKAQRLRLVQALVANVQRADLNPIEEAKALGAMHAMGMTQIQIAEWVGWSMMTVVNRLALLDLDPELQTLVAAGTLPRDARVAHALLTIQDSETRIKLGERLARPGITITAIVAACQRLNERLSQERTPTDTRAPALALMQRTPAPTKSQQWRDIRASAQGTCDKCDSNPHLPDLPEPAWSIIMQSAETTCNACSLRQSANLSICRQCPAVELLNRMVANVR